MSRLTTGFNSVDWAIDSIGSRHCDQRVSGSRSNYRNAQVCLGLFISC